MVMMCKSSLIETIYMAKSILKINITYILFLWIGRNYTSMWPISNIYFILQVLFKK